MYHIYFHVVRIQILPNHVQFLEYECGIIRIIQYLFWTLIVHPYLTPFTFSTLARFQAKRKVAIVVEVESSFVYWSIFNGGHR
jgi:hypothetical protein